MSVQVKILTDKEPAELEHEINSWVGNNRLALTSQTMLKSQAPAPPAGGHVLTYRIGMFLVGQPLQAGAPVQKVTIIAGPIAEVERDVNEWCAMPDPRLIVGMTVFEPDDAGRMAVMLAWLPKQKDHGLQVPQLREMPNIRRNGKH